MNMNIPEGREHFAKIKQKSTQQSLTHRKKNKLLNHKLVGQFWSVSVSVTLNLTVNEETESWGRQEETSNHFSWQHPDISRCFFFSFGGVSGCPSLEGVWWLCVHLCVEEGVDVRPNTVRLCAGKRVQNSLWPKVKKQRHKEGKLVEIKRGRYM